MAVFPYEDPAISDCLMEGDGYKPAAAGGLIYLNADEDTEGNAVGLHAIS